MKQFTYENEIDSKVINKIIKAYASKSRLITCKKGITYKIISVEYMSDNGYTLVILSKQ